MHPKGCQGRPVPKVDRKHPVRKVQNHRALAGRYAAHFSNRALAELMLVRASRYSISVASLLFDADVLDKP